jgi:hypothetical protein
MQEDLPFRTRDAPIRLHEVDLSGHIEDRGDPVVPERKCGYHRFIGPGFHKRDPYKAAIVPVWRNCGMNL